MARDAEALRLLQGLPARMPDRRRHGAHEDRGAGRARRQARPLAARPAGRLPAALCAVCGAAGRGLANLRDDKPEAQAWSEHCRAERAAQLPRWRSDAWREPCAHARRRRSARGRALRRHLQPLFRAREHRGRARRAARRRLRRASAEARGRSSRPLCCGRTFLAVGLVEEARREAERCVAALAPLVARGMPVVGLEPSCILGFRDELPALIKSDDARALASQRAAVRGIPGARAAAGTLDLPLKPLAKRALLHGHCHQKSSAPWARSRRRSSSSRILRSRPSSRAAAAWPAPSATAPTRSMCRSRWRSSRCCRRCARPRPIRWSWPTAPPAGIRSRTAAGARRCMSRACWR